jgi:[protein-PII] uridylyltransferase
MPTTDDARGGDDTQIDLDALARVVVAQGRETLRARHAAGASGRDVINAFTLLIDRLLTTLFAGATQEYVSRQPRLKYRCAVMAQGGYGRRELSPHSDIDLVFLYPWKVSPYVESVAQKILYNLWDAGLQVGHALRNPRACLRLGARELTIRTALLDARYVCGDLAVFHEFKEAVHAELLTKQGSAFLEHKLAETAERHRRYGESVYLLQPHLKEGEGGLRDCHTALWMAKVKFKIRRLKDLVSLGIMTERDLAEFEMSQDFLWRVRNGLHFAASGYQDALTFDYQERIAAELGYHDTPSERGVDRFMRFYYLHAATIHRFSDGIISRCIERTRTFKALGGPTRTIRPGMQIGGNALSVAGVNVFRQHPDNLIRVFAETQRHGVGLSSITKKLIREQLHLLDDPQRRLPETVAAFFDILDGGSRVYETLHEMHKQGVLVQFIPEFANLLCRVQRDMYHMYTVDEHSLRGILELERLRAGDYARECPLLTQVMREEEGVDILFLSMLFHDIGKGWGHDHSERGAAIVRAIAARLDMNPDDADQLEFLVRHHLLMSHLAQRRDIQDEHMVRGFAEQVGDTSTLRKLYLLTFADMKAVGPTFWNNWRSMLLGELYVRTARMLEHGFPSEEDRAARVERVKERLRRMLAGHPVQARLEAFLASMPGQYFLTTPEDSMPEHVVLVDRFRTAAAQSERPTVTALRHFPERDHSVFTVCTAERPGVFSKVAGVLAAAGMNVVGARITTSADGVVLDTFRISHVERREAVLEGHLWERVGLNLERAIRDEVDVETLVEESRRSPMTSSSARKGLPRIVTRVAVDNEVSRDYTVLDIYTEDRIGVLFAITHSLHQLGVRTHLAKITTTLNQVLDVFYVTDLTGQKLTDDKRLAEIERGLMDRLASAVADRQPVAQPV